MKDIITFIKEKNNYQKEIIPLKQFIEWYNGEKVTKITPDILEDMGWDYLEDDLNMSLEEISKLFNDNLDKDIEFDQEDIGNCISISFKIGNKTIEVDSTNFYGEKLN